MTAATIRPPEPGDGPLACVFDVRCNAALTLEADHEFGVVVVKLAGEPKASAIIAPETALELARRLVGTVAELHRPPEGRP